MKNFNNKVAAITGAGSGIGRATAVLLASKGCHLAISDVDKLGLEETAKQAASYGVKVTTYTLDVSNKEAVYEYADNVVQDHGKVNIIMNNAGVALGASVESMSYEDFEWLFNINFWGVVYGTKAFLPYLKQSNEEAQIINVSSVFGLFSVPTQSAYNAAKFAVRGFTEALRIELKIGNGNVSCSTVHPGGIKTNIAVNARQGDTASAGGISKEKATKDFEKLARTTPKQAAEIIIHGVSKDKSKILIGADAFIFDKIQRFFPTGYQRVLAFLARTQVPKKK